MCYFLAVCWPIGLKLWWVVGAHHRYLATRWRPYRPPGGASGGQKVLFGLKLCWLLLDKFWSDIPTTNSHKCLGTIVVPSSGRFAAGRGLQQLWRHLDAGLQQDGDFSNCCAI